jgi:hypothetical protein
MRQALEGLAARANYPQRGRRHIGKIWDIVCRFLSVAHALEAVIAFGAGTIQTTKTFGFSLLRLSLEQSLRALNGPEWRLH